MLRRAMSPRTALAVLGVVVSANAAAPAQEPGVSGPRTDGGRTAVLTGRVLDAGTARPIAGAEVLVIAGRDTIRVRAGDGGEWRVAPRGAGPWRVRARFPGYAPLSLSAAQLPGTLEHRLAPAALSLDAVVVSSARREQRLKDAVATIELITRRDLEATAAPDIAAVLVEQTGIQLDGGIPAGAGLQLQGLSSQRVLILLDGQPLGGRLNGNFDVSRLPVSMIERIEVVKGPQSTLYGTDAMGGVINIVTRKAGASEGAGTLSMLGGSVGRRDASVDGTGRMGRFAWSGDAGLRQIDLVPGRADDGQTFANRGHANGRMEWRADSGVTVFASGFGMGEAQRYLTGQLFRFADNRQYAGRAGVTWQRGAHRLQPLVHWTQFTHLSRAALGPQPVADSGARDRQTLAEFELTYNGPVPVGMLDAGLEIRQDAIRADRVPGIRSLDQAEPYAQLTMARGNLSVVPGVRATFNRQWGRFLTPRVAVLWRPLEPLAVRANWGEGFRAPDFKELYLEFVNPSVGYAVRGNPNLRPETSRNVSLGLEWAQDIWFARVNGFHNTFRDFIETGAQDATGTFSYGNIARGTTSGADAEAGYAHGAWRAEVGWSWLRARDASTGRALLNRPPQSGRAMLAWSRGGWRTSATLIHTGATPIFRDPIAGSLVDRIPFTRTDVRLAKVVGRTTWQFGVDNAFNAQLGQDWPGFTGRVWYGGASVTIGRR